MKPKIYFVILTYYPKQEVLERTVKILKGYDVVIVDNTPLESFHKSVSDIIVRPGLTIMRNRKNLGYTGGMNAGIRYALSKGSLWVILLNDDIALNRKDVNKLAKKLPESRPGIVGPFPGQLDAKRWTTIYPSIGNHFVYLSGSCMAIHRDVVQRIGVFYEPYFIYYEEAEYCIQAQKAGFNLTYISLPHTKHADAATFGKGTEMHNYYLARNHLLFVERNAPRIVKLYEYLRLPKTVFEHIIRDDRGGMAGIWDYFLRSFGIYKG